MNKAVAGNITVPSSETVGVGYFARFGMRPPVLPHGYDLHPIDAYLHSEISTFQICLLGAPAAEQEELLEEAASLLGEDCLFISCVAELPGLEDRMRLLGLGADDIVEQGDTDMIALALKRAQISVERRNRLHREFHRVTSERNNLQAAIDNLPSPIFFKNRKGIYSGCNKAFEAYIGMPAHEVHGSSVYDVAPFELAQVYEAADEKLMKEGGVQIYDTEVRYATGDLRSVTFHKGVTRDRMTGEVNGLAGAMLDITERKRLEERLKRAAERDDLTNAYNRRKFFELAGEIEARSRRDAVNLSVLVVDVDHFKQINDHFGHACGDATLCHLVGILEEELGDPHIFARAGGEEFFCLLYDCDLHPASRIADGIRQRVEAFSYKFDGLDIVFKVSIGIAGVGPSEKLSQAIIRADQALYRAKKAGRNRIVQAS